MERWLVGMASLGVLALPALVSLSTASACAGLIADEGFDYDPGAALNGCGGGTGFNGAWFVDRHSYAVAPGSLADPSGMLPVSGNSLRHTGLLPRAKRDLSTVLGATGSTVYLSFLVRQDAIGDFIQDDHDFGGLILGGTNGPNAFGNLGLYVGRGGRGDRRDQWVLGKASTPEEASSGVPVLVGSTALLAVRVDFLDGLDRATLHVNPTPGLSEPASGTVYNGVDLDEFTQIAVTNGNNSVWTTDEIRVATTWEEVTPVPEPSALIICSLLATLGLTVGWWRRRRRAA